MIDVIIITLLIYYYQMLPRPETIPKSKWSCMCFTLPELTGTCARDANQLGAFGLEVRPLPRLTKTLHEDRGLLWLVWSALPILTTVLIWLRTCHCPPLPAIGLRHDTLDQHSTVDTAVDEYSIVEQCGTAWAGPTAQVDRTPRWSHTSDRAHGTAHSTATRCTQSGVARTAL